jgi:hypothetical protein
MIYKHVLFTLVMAPKETKQTKPPVDYRACDRWRFKYNMRLDTAKDILDFVKQNNLKDTKSILK